MTESLFSPLWYRVAEARPRLRGHVQITRQPWRDRFRIVLTDTNTGRQHQVNDIGYQFIGRCDGTHTVQQVWDAMLDQCGDDAPTQDDVIGLLTDLHAAGLLQSDSLPNAGGPPTGQRTRRQRRARAQINPLAFRIPLGDPSRWLGRLDPLGRVVFSAPMFWAWLVFVAAVALFAATQITALQAHAKIHLLTPRYLWLSWLCYPLMKTLHELGHALAVRRWGGSVREMGMGLFVLVPSPYVDASAATAFRHRTQRACVSGAGIMVELAVAAAGLIVWSGAQPGLVRDIAFVALMIGAVSTVLFNANPLMRFDGYYLLCDLCDLPNLAARSGAFWRSLARRHLVRLHTEPLPCARGERPWLIVYAPAALGYRCAVAWLTVRWLGSHAGVLGIGVAAYFVVTLFGQPAWRYVRRATRAIRAGREPWRILGVPAFLVALGTVAACAVPLPCATTAAAIVAPPEQADVRSEVDGFVIATPQPDGSAVNTGDVIAVLDNPELRAERARIASRLEGLLADRYQHLLHDTAAARRLTVDIEHAQADRDRADERIAALTVRARTSGRLVLPHAADLGGTFVRRGTTFGHILSSSDIRVRAAVLDDDASLVQSGIRSAEVHLAEDPGDARVATLIGTTPDATHDLPSPALGDRSGGPFVTDPADHDGTRSLEPLFVIELRLAGAPLERVGGRAWVRLLHDDQPLAFQAYRAVRRVFLAGLDTATAGATR